MRDDKQECEVWLVKDGRLVTRFNLDVSPGTLVREISSERRKFRCFGRGEKLAAVQHDRRVLVCVASQTGMLAALVEKPARKVCISTIPKTDNLTDRQLQVLVGLSGGQTLAAIGFRLGIRERSVRHHVDALKRRLGALSLGELVARALAGGLLESTPPQGGTGAGRQSKNPKIV